MDAAANDLTRPLGRPGPPTPPSRWKGPATVALIIAGFSAGAVFALAALYGNPLADRPVIRSAIVARPPDPAPATGRDSGPTPDPGRRDATSIEAGSGVSIVRPPGTEPLPSVIVSVPEIPRGLAPAPDPRLVERTRAGLLPRIGPDGARPAEVYARPPGELASGARPLGRVAIVVGGVGIGRVATDEAIARLPAAVSLAVAPYGADLDGIAERARANGHEILLQVPMEPFDFPDSDPGPHTLLAGAKPAENQEHLRWAMGRFVGYVGVMNYMGGKLTSDEAALAPVLREIGGRGLGFVDDGTSSRSRAVALAGETRASRAEIVLDAAPRAEAIDKALRALEAMAAAAPGRVILASASALPLTTDRIARWAEGAAERGILLVPASAGWRREAERR